MQGRGDQTAYADYIGTDLHGLVKQGGGWDHDAQVRDFEAAAGKDNGGDVLAYVVNIALYGSNEELRLVAYSIAAFHIRFEHGNGLSHDAGRLDHLGKEHLPVSEKGAHTLHSGHQRTLYDSNCAAEPFKAFQCIYFQIERQSFDHCIRKSFFRFGRNLFHCLCGVFPRAFREHFRSLDNESGSRLRVAVEDDILHRTPQVGIYVVVDLQHLRIDYGHVQSGLHRVVQEDRMHRLAHGIVPSEREGKVGYSAGGQGSGEVLLDPSHRLDEIHSEAGVLLYSCAN